MCLAKCTERTEELDIPCILATVVVIIVVSSLPLWRRRERRHRVQHDINFKTKKKNKTKKELKEREARRRLRHIEWLSSPKGTPRPLDTDDES